MSDNNEQSNRNENDPEEMKVIYLSRKAEFEAAAAAGNAAACRLLGNMYYHDWLGEPDYDRAEELYQRSADGGDPVGKLCLANLWLEGRGHGTQSEALILVSECARESGRVVIRHENPNGTLHYTLSATQRTIPVRKR